MNQTLHDTVLQNSRQREIFEINSDFKSNGQLISICKKELNFTLASFQVDC